MTAIAALTLADGQATPVNHTFAPVRITQEGIAQYADRSGGIAIGFPAISVSMREPTKNSRAYKLTMKVVVPTLEQTSASTATGIQPAPTKAYDNFCYIDMVMPERSTLQERKNLVAYVRNLLANGLVTAAVESYESIY